MKKVIFFIALIVIIGTAVFFRNDILDILFKSLPKLPAIQEIKSLEETIIKEISNPPPLRVKTKEPTSVLTKAGVIKWTNAQRIKEGLAPLTENSLLNDSAKIKVEDMFTNQYFAHESLSGLGAGDLAKEVGYEFIAIGENLALGNFKDDEALVDAWMNSPGHRENILNIKYQEIGVSVIKGKFEGETVWLAVQHFGKPLSACPKINDSLSLMIEVNKKNISDLEQTLNVLQEDIDNTQPKGGPIYSQKIEEYNGIVEEYNSLIETTKILIDQYNSQVKIFNDCLSGIK